MLPKHGRLKVVTTQKSPNFPLDQQCGERLYAVKVDLTPLFAIFSTAVSSVHATFATSVGMVCLHIGSILRSISNVCIVTARAVCKVREHVHKHEEGGGDTCQRDEPLQERILGTYFSTKTLSFAPLR